MAKTGRKPFVETHGEEYKFVTIRLPVSDYEKLLTASKQAGMGHTQLARERVVVHGDEWRERYNVLRKELALLLSASV